MDRLIKATGYSVAGFKHAWQSEAAFRQEVILCIFLLPAALFLGETGIERALLCAVLLSVLIVELLNSGLEAVVDRIDEEVHPLSKAAKDVGSAAVFVSLANVIVVWALVLG